LNYGFFVSLSEVGNGQEAGGPRMQGMCPQDLLPGDVLDEAVWAGN